MVSRINTPLGRGRIVYKLKDGTYVVEFDHGGGKIFLPEELFPCLKSEPTETPGMPRHPGVPGPRCEAGEN